MLFTFIVPVYNVAPYLEKCVISLLNQTAMGEQTEILLIDDGSKDESGKICDRLSREHSRIKVFHKENGGLSSARNEGLKNASGEYVLFVDSDDYIAEDTCQILYSVIEKYEGADAVSFGGVEDYGNFQKPMRRISVRESCSDGKTYLMEHYKEHNVNVEVCLYSYRRHFLLDSNLWFKEGILHEDVEFTPRALLRCKRIVEIPNELYHYIIRSNSISTKKDQRKNIQDLFQTLKELDKLAERQDEELCRWMKNTVLNSYLNMIYAAGMYQPQYRKMIDKRFLLGKAATGWNRCRVVLCLLNVRLYCWLNDCYKAVRQKR